MANPLVTGIFDSRAAAAHAREALLAQGIAGDRITMSEMQTSDGIAAEAPGETYQNQVGEDRESAARGRFGFGQRTPPHRRAAALERRARGDAAAAVSVSG